MDAGRFILVRLKLSHVYPKMPRYINLIWLLLMGPLAIATIIFGVLAGGTTVHLRTVHGVSSPSPVFSFFFFSFLFFQKQHN